MQFEYNDYQVMEVEEVDTGNQVAVIRHHYTFVRHVQVFGPEVLSVGEEGVFTFSWRDWQGNTLDDQESFIVEVAGQVIEVRVGEPLEFSSDEPGEYIIRTVNPRVKNAEIKVVVMNA